MDDVAELIVETDNADSVVNVDASMDLARAVARSFDRKLTSTRSNSLSNSTVNAINACASAMGGNGVGGDWRAAILAPLRAEGTPTLVLPGPVQDCQVGCRVGAWLVRRKGWR
jgi:hypothetical protein